LALGFSSLGIDLPTLDFDGSITDAATIVGDDNLYALTSDWRTKWKAYSIPMRQLSCQTTGSASSHLIESASAINAPSIPSLWLLKHFR
jgi:hypothetical protein